MADEVKEEAKKDEGPTEKFDDSSNEAKSTVEESKNVPTETKEQPKVGKPKEEPKKDLLAGSQEVKVSGKLGGIIKDIEGLRVLELSDLVKALEEKFGVTATAPVAVVSGAAAGGEDAEEGPEEGQTSFNVILKESGANKISVIKAVREILPSLGLKEAKDLVDAAPKQVLEGVGKDGANEAKQKLEAAGAKVELQ